MIKTDPDRSGELLQTEIPVEQIQRYESAGSASTRELEALFASRRLTSEPEGIPPHESVDERIPVEILTRRGQRAFRERLIAAYGGRAVPPR